MDAIYLSLTERAQALNQEREALIERRNKLQNELRLIVDRLNVVDGYLDDIYEDQQSYWPPHVVEDIDHEILNPVGLVQEFIANPNLTQKQLAERYNTKTPAVQKLLAKHFKNLNPMI